jgi:DNA-binding SARP family transcriptional activator
MEFRILGPFEVLDEGRVVALGGSKQRALLALLVLHANETLTTDRLIDELWGERPPATATKTVQVHISRLRRTLGARAGDGSAGAVVTRDHGYALALDPELIDACRFERLVAEGRNELAAGRPRRAASVLEEAFSLWRGRPLGDLSFEAFAQGEIARLDELRVAGLELLIDAKLTLGRHAEMVGELERLVGEHPYRERLRAQLMLALYRSDRQADALQAYQDARSTLVDELGIEPGERLRELERAVLKQDPTLGLPAEAERAAEEPGAATRGRVFVGRGRELADLVAGLEDAFAGRGRLVLLVGEPGIGKSRLAEEVIARAGPRGARVLVGRCWEAGGAPAYWPWVQALRALVRESDPAALRAQTATGAAYLARIVPELRRCLPDLPEPPALDSEAARFRLFDAAAEFLRNASQRRPIVLVLDDLHAADAPSLLLVRFLARELGSMRMLVLAIYRDVDPTPDQPLTEMLVELAREPFVRGLPLGGLSEHEVAEYLELTAPEIATPGLLAALEEETAGNPLFVGEIVRLLSAEGVRPESTAELRLVLPQSVRDVIARRLTHLTQESNRVLELASVLGREFDLAALARLADVSEDELLDLLDEALAARLVAEVPGAPTRMRFAHVLIRDTLYEGLAGARRVRLHRQAVEALEALYGAQPGPELAELAHHCMAGREFDSGFQYARRAGERTLALLAYEEAARLYGMALDALELTHPQDESARCALLLSLGEARIRAGDLTAAKGAFLEGAGIARRLGLTRELARAAAGYGGRYMWARAAGDDRLVPLLEEGLAALGDEDVELRARLLARLAGVLRDEHSRDRRDMLSREAVVLARQTGNLAALAYALDGRAAAISAPDTVAECLALATELREVAERIGDIERVANSLDHVRTAQVISGDLRATEDALTLESRIAEDLRQPSQFWQVHSSRAMLALAAGRLGEAEHLISQAFAVGEHALPGVAIPVHRLQRFALRDFHARLEEVAPEIRDLVAAYPTRPAFRCALAYLEARLGRSPEAKRAFDDLARDEFSILPFDQEWLYGMSLLAETSALLGETDSAAVLYQLLLPWAAFNAGNHPEGIRGSMSRYLGLLATTTKRWEAAQHHFEEGLIKNAEMLARPWLAHTQSDYARMLLARNSPGDRERAQPLLDSAQETYRDLGMNNSPARPAAPPEQAGTPRNPPFSV